MAEEALRRAKAIAAKWNQTGGQGNDDVASAGSALESENSESSDSGDRGASGKRPNNFVGNSEKIFVPVNERRDIQWVGLICGPRGSNIARIREASNGCEVKLRGKGSTRDGQNEGNEDLHVLLEGTNAQIDIARGMINDLLENPDKVKAQQLQSLGGGAYQDIPMAKEDDPYEEMYVPNSMVGTIIGRGGEKIRELQIMSGASIQMQREIEMEPGQEGRRLTMRGSKESIEKAKELIQQTMEESKRENELRRMRRSGSHNQADRKQTLRGGPIHRKVRILDNTVGAVIGRGGATINQINAVSGAVVNIPKEPDASDARYRTVTICGPTDESCQIAQDEIVKVLQQRQRNMGAGGNMDQNGSGGQLAPGHVAIEFQIPNEHTGRVIGKQGSTIQRLKQMFGVHINIPRDIVETEKGQMRTVKITGLQQGTEDCKVEIARMLSAYSQDLSLELVGGDRSRLSRSRSRDPGMAGYNYGMMHGGNMMMGGAGGMNPNNPYAAQWAAYYAQQAIMQQQQGVGNQGSAEVDAERKKNLDPSNPYRQQWVEYYAQQDKKKADAAAASNTDSSNAGNSTATNDSSDVNGKNAADNGNIPAASDASSSNAAEEDPERKKNLDPNNPYRQQWVEYYAQQDKKKADAAAASSTNSSSAGNSTATNDSTNVNGKNGADNGNMPAASNASMSVANGGSSTNTSTNSNAAEEDPERKKNLDPNNPYRQQWVEYYAQQDKKKADAAAASSTNSSSAENSTATNDSTNVNGENGADNGNMPAASDASMSVANGGSSTNTSTNSNAAEEDPERKKNLDPNNPYRQQWVEYYAQQDKEKGRCRRSFKC